jgi:hypothetical protein
MTNPATWGTIADLSVELIVPRVGALGDDELVDAQREIARIRQRAEVCAAAVAAEIAHRSRHELGSAGLAQRKGARSPEVLIQRISGTSSRDARTLVRVGEMMPSAGDDRPSGTAWRRAIVERLADGRITVEAADAIRSAFTSLSDGIDPQRLIDGITELVDDAEHSTVEELGNRARELRDIIDAEGVADRERMRRDRRYLHLMPQPDGMTRVSGLLDPESAAIVCGAVDAITSPRRGGPRFIDVHLTSRAEELLRDERTIPQMAVDALVDMVRIATFADRGAVFGGRRPAVQVLVAERDLRETDAVANLEGQVDAVSVATARRHICDAGLVATLFDDDGQAVNVGRAQRLFTSRQRIGMAGRDGGCRFPGCNRPPSWTEAHHIDEWLLDHGKTDIADGVLLCRHHHLLTHNNGWRVQRSGGRYWVVPPASEDPERRPIPAPSRSSAMRRALSARTA